MRVWGRGRDCGGGWDGGRLFRRGFDSRHCFGSGLYSMLFDGTQLNLQVNKRGQDIALFLPLHFPLSCHSLMATHSVGLERPVIRAAMPRRHSATSNLLLEEPFFMDFKWHGGLSISSLFLSLSHTHIYTQHTPYSIC